PQGGQPPQRQAAVPREGPLLEGSEGSRCARRAWRHSCGCAGSTLHRRSPARKAMLRLGSATKEPLMPNQSWIITTAVGTGERGFAGDGGPADRAVLNGPFDVGFDPDGNLYFSDTFNHRIRRVDARTGVIRTCAGSGERGYAGDGGPAIGAQLNEPYGI